MEMQQQMNRQKSVAVTMVDKPNINHRVRQAHVGADASDFIAAPFLMDRLSEVGAPHDLIDQVASVLENF